MKEDEKTHTPHFAHALSTMHTFLYYKYNILDVGVPVSLDFFFRSAEFDAEKR